jgi:3-oxoacyl-[acyl-carrier protein] reductase
MGTDISAEEVEDTKNEINQHLQEQQLEGQMQSFVADITKKEQAEALIQTTLDQYKKIDILINNAGGVVGQTHQPIEKVTDEQWMNIMQINLNAVFFMIRAVTPIMKEQSYGRIVNISSGAGRSASLTGIQAYTSSKAGQIGLTRQMARELGPYGITVNNVAPGFVLSNLSTTKQWEAMKEEGKKQLLESISLKRLGTPEEIAYPVLFLASDFASYISGQVITADGGLQLF